MVKLETEVKREIRRMALGCAICTAAVILGFWAFGRLDASVWIGGGLGWVLAAGNFYLMSLGITKALATGDEAAAKLKMHSSYIGRTVVMLAIIALSILVDGIHWLPVVASVFYPRIVITAVNFWGLYRNRKNPPEPSAAEGTAEQEEDGDGESDEFEKFVSGFSKGPVPGEPVKASSQKGKEENGDDDSSLA